MVTAGVVEAGIIDMELEISVPVIHWHKVEPEQGLEIFLYDVAHKQHVLHEELV